MNYDRLTVFRELDTWFTCRYSDDDMPKSLRRKLLFSKVRCPLRLAPGPPATVY
ncbi:MAG TPA: hypothetical protein VMP01_23780 [Pirellulaceae bacterium]|nr:hypothetical protein [Pirellulaceae bacterium]